MSPQEASQTSTTCDVAGPGQQVMGTAAEVAGDAVGNAMGMILQPVLEASIEPVLMSLARKVGEIYVEVAIKKFSRMAPGLADVPNLVEEVTKETSSTMMSFREELLEYCGDVMGCDEKRGNHVVRCDLAKGFEHVVIDFMKAILFGTWEAEDVVYSLLPGFGGQFLRTARSFHSNSYDLPECCDICFGQVFPNVCEEVLDQGFALIEGFLKAELKKGNLPPQVAELLPWNVIDELKHLCERTGDDVLGTLEIKQPPPKSGKRFHPQYKDRDDELGEELADEMYPAF